MWCQQCMYYTCRTYRRDSPLRSHLDSSAPRPAHVCPNTCHNIMSPTALMVVTGSTSSSQRLVHTEFQALKLTVAHNPKLHKKREKLATAFLVEMVKRILRTTKTFASLATAMSASCSLYLEERRPCRTWSWSCRNCRLAELCSMQSSASAYLRLG